MDKVTFVWPEWAMEAVESESQDSIVYRARRAVNGETQYAAIKMTNVPVSEGENRAEVRSRIDAWAAKMASLRNVPNLLVPEDVQVTPTANGFTVQLLQRRRESVEVKGADHDQTC